MKTQETNHIQKTPHHKENRLRESISKAFNSVLKHDVSPSRLKGQEPPETRMVYSMAYHYLSEKHPRLGEDMLKSVPKMRVSLRDKGEKAPIFKATDRYVQKLVKENKITKEEGEKIMCYAVGKANLIGEKGELTTKRVRLEKGRENMDAVIEKMLSNKSATAEELDAARKSVEGKNTKTDPAQPFIPGEAPKPENEPELPGDLVYRPDGSPSIGLNGMATLRLPSFYNGQIDAVGVFDSNGEQIGELTHKGTSGKNSIWAFDKPGSSLGNGITLKLRHLNGGVVSIAIPDGATFHRERYAE